MPLRLGVGLMGYKGHRLGLVAMVVEFWAETFPLRKERLIDRSLFLHKILYFYFSIFLFSREIILQYIMRNWQRCCPQPFYPFNGAAEYKGWIVIGREITGPGVENSVFVGLDGTSFSGNSYGQII